MMKNKRSFKIMDKFMEYGDINVKFNNLTYKDLTILIPNAWNYEANVYEVLSDGELELIFSPEMNREQFDNLKKYGYEIVDHGGYRYLKSIEDSTIWILEYRVDELSKYILENEMEDIISIGLAHELTLI